MVLIDVVNGLVPKYRRPACLARALTEATEAKRAASWVSRRIVDGDKNEAEDLLGHRIIIVNNRGDVVASEGNI